PGLVPPSHARLACRCLPARHHRPEPPHGICPTCRASGRRPAHPVDSLRSPPPAGPPDLSGAHFRSPDLPVVDFSAHPSVLGRLLSSSPSPESQVSLFVEPSGL